MSSERPDLTHIEDPPSKFKDAYRFFTRGDRFGRYEVLTEIGVGTLGRVYRACDPLTSREVAIKTMRTEYLPARTAEVYRRRFQVEAQAAGGLSHPNVIRIYDQGEDYLVMEYLDGVALSRLLCDRRLPLEESLLILSGVGAALDHAHAHGVVHRDVRPGNVMVLHDGSAKLIDFGLARIRGDEPCVAEKFLGLPSYMAPEQIVHDETSPRSDLFSLGTLAYEMLTGQRPFHGENVGTITYRVVYEEPPPPTRANPLLPVAYDEILARALAKEPGERLPSASALVRALQAYRLPSTRFRNTRRPRPRAVPPEPPASDPRAEETQDLSRQMIAAAQDGGIAGDDAAPTLELTSDPIAASVWVDGVRMGTSPVALTLVPGLHTIRVMADGFSPVQLAVNLRPRTVLPTMHFTLQPVLMPASREDSGDSLARGVLAAALSSRPA